MHREHDGNWIIKLRCDVGHIYRSSDEYLNQTSNFYTGNIKHAKIFNSKSAAQAEYHKYEFVARLEG